MKLNKQTILMSLGVFGAIVAAVVIVYFVRGGSTSVEEIQTETPMDQIEPTVAPIFQVTGGTNSCALSFEVPCSPGMVCKSKKAYENVSGNTAGSYSFTRSISSGAVVDEGQTLVYQLTYENTGNTTIASAVFTDVIPSTVDYMDGQTACSYAPTTRTVSCTVSNIVAGATGNVAFRVKVKDPATVGEFVNTATLTPSAGQVTTCAIPLKIAAASLSPSPSTSVSPSPSPLTSNLDCLYKKVYEDDSRNRAGFYYIENLISDTRNLQDGQTIVYSVGMKNHGQASASDVKITDVLSSNLTFVDADNGCSYEASSRRVTCEVGSLAGGVETARSIRVRVGVSSNTSILNTAEVFSSNGQRDTCSVTVDAAGKVVPPPSPSPIVTQVEQTTTLPTAGVFEVTAGTIGAGVLFLILGAIGLLIL